jgi:hypothetical protein
MKKVLSMIRDLIKSAQAEIHYLRRDFRNHFPLLFKLVPDESAEETVWDVQDPYAESIFKQIRSANEAK